MPTTTTHDRRLYGLTGDAVGDGEGQSRRCYRAFLEDFHGIAYESTLDLRPVVLLGALEAVSGYHPNQFLGGALKWDYLVVPADAPRLRFERERVCNVPGYTFDLEYRIVRKDGEVRWVREVCRNVCDGEGVPCRIHGSIGDIDSYKQAEKERVEVEVELQRAQKRDSLGLMAAGVAHDFNNLLTAILGNTDLALEDLAAGSMARECVENVDLAARRAAELSKLMLTYVGQGRCSEEEIDLSVEAHEITAVMRPLLSESAVFTCDFGVGLPRIMGDRSQVRQVVTSLLANASEALESASGQVGVRTYTQSIGAEDFCRSHIETDHLPPGDYVCLEVEDTGCGIRTENLSNIFDPFYSTKFTGRGMGLAATVGVVRGHRGAICVESEFGRGSTFTVLLPAFRPTAVAKTTPTVVARDDSARRCVLLVDDEQAIVKVAARMLERVGLEVLIAMSGTEAVEVFQQNWSRLDLVILDFSMPDMDGAQTLSKLQAIGETVPVIMSSGYSEQRVSHSILDDGAAEFLQKPYHYEELIAKVEKVLGLAR